MKITNAAIDHSGPWGSVEIGPLPEQLSVVFGPHNAGKTTLADLVAETLFGVGVSAAAGDAPAGHVDVASQPGRYRLRRRQAAPGAGRFTIAGLDGQPASAVTLPQLIGSGSAEAIARVFFASGDQLRDSQVLLSDVVAREFQRLESQSAPQREHPADTSELLSRRDQIAHEIEQRLGDRRRSSGELESQLAAIDADATQLTSRREAVEKSLRGVESELAIIESKIRYQAFADEADLAAQQRESADWRRRLAELEQQIEQWRATLGELELRQSQVQTELSVVHPDDSEPSLSLADQRAGLAVARRLTEDLESEVARLARSAASEVCVCRDAHPRLNPLVDTLARQLTRLAELGEQQEQALHVQSLQAEAAHLARSQDDLRKQLDHLLGRRQALWRTTRSRPDEALNEHQEGDERITGDSGYGPADRTALDNRRHELVGELAQVDQRLQQLTSERATLTSRRTGLLSDAALDALQSELNELQARLAAPRWQQTASVDRGLLESRWRASEWFAKLTDGRFTGLQLTAGGRGLVATEVGGRERRSESLSTADQQLAAISLRLALVGGFSHYGLSLPLVLDEPFSNLESRQVAILASVLDDFSRLGFQVLVFTANRHAADRFKTLGVALLPLARSAQIAGNAAARETRAPITRQFVSETASREPATTTRVAQRTETSEYLLAPEDPIERFPVPMANRTGVFARSRVRTIGDLMSADPSALTEELDRDDVTAELASLWQTHLALVCFVPGMTFEDASLLSSVGILSAGELARIDVDELDSRVRQFLRTERGERYRSRRQSYSRETAADWVSRGERGMRRWRDSQDWNNWRRHRGERRSRLASHGYETRSPRGESSERSSRNRLRVRSADKDRGSTRTTSKSAERTASRTGSSRRNGQTERVWRFYLETTSPVVDAPSIGPKTAKRLEKAGVHTVADLLAADAELLAGAVDQSRITSETVVAWQHQAQLVCRIPQLRGHDAQILVGCGFTSPEEIAAMQPAELLEFVEPFCASSEGQRILRNSAAPDLAEVTDWITWSGHCRMLGAA